MQDPLAKPKWYTLIKDFDSYEKHLDDAKCASSIMLSLLTPYMQTSVNMRGRPKSWICGTNKHLMFFL